VVIDGYEVLGGGSKGVGMVERDKGKEPGIAGDGVIAFLP
jgi:hypothetical protein